MPEAVEDGILAERDVLQLSRLSGHAIARLVQTQVEVVLSLTRHTR